MASSHLKSYKTTADRRLDDHLGLIEPEVTIFLPVDVKNAEELDFDATDVIA